MYKNESFIDLCKNTLKCDDYEEFNDTSEIVDCTDLFCCDCPLQCGDEKALDNIAVIKNVQKVI